MKRRDDDILEVKRKLPTGSQHTMLIDQLKQRCSDQRKLLSIFMEEIRLKPPNKGRKVPCFYRKKTMTTIWNFQVGIY